MNTALYNETVTVKRLEDGAGVVKEFADHIVGLRCLIQPLDSEISADIEGGFGKEWLMFCPPVDLQEGDRVFRTVGVDTKEYRVTGVESLSFMNQEHMEVRIRIFES